MLQGMADYPSGRWVPSDFDNCRLPRNMPMFATPYFEAVRFSMSMSTRLIFKVVFTKPLQPPHRPGIFMWFRYRRSKVVANIWRTRCEFSDLH